MTQPISIDLVTVDPRLQSRAALDREAVADYADRYREGAEMPPVVVFYDERGDHWLADGFHRFAAAKEARLTEIPADVRKGEYRDALLHSASANAAHGLRRTNADKRRSVEMLLSDPEWRQKSDWEISRHCGVTADLVGVIRTLSKVDSVPAEQNPAIALNPNIRVYRNKHGGISKMNVANIGKARRKAAASPAPGELPAIDDPPKPCPFCAKAETRIGYNDGTKTHRVFCQSCTAIGPGGDTKERAIFDWNYRE